VTRRFTVALILHFAAVKAHGLNARLRRPALKWNETDATLFPSQIAGPGKNDQ
jgi:hypothetical protein